MSISIVQHITLGSGWQLFVIVARLNWGAWDAVECTPINILYSPLSLLAYTMITQIHPTTGKFHTNTLVAKHSQQIWSGINIRKGSTLHCGQTLFSITHNSKAVIATILKTGKENLQSSCYTILCHTYSLHGHNDHECHTQSDVDH